MALERLLVPRVPALEVYYYCYYYHYYCTTVHVMHMQRASDGLLVLQTVTALECHEISGMLITESCGGLKASVSWWD